MSTRTVSKNSTDIVGCGYFSERLAEKLLEYIFRVFINLKYNYDCGYSKKLGTFFFQKEVEAKSIIRAENQ